MIKLHFLKRGKVGGISSKVGASLSKGAVIQFTKACNEAFNFNENFNYVRIALDEDQQAKGKVNSIFIVEETDKKAIESDIEVIKMTLDTSAETKRFSYSPLLKFFFTDKELASTERIKSRRFTAEQKEIEGYKVLHLTFVEE